MVDHVKIESAERAKEHPEYLAALQELLFQLADDDFLLAYRGSEWLALAPHIEEDVAFSSMSQDMMGHAVICYEMLEELGAGKADDLAQLREAHLFRNAIMAERPNGSGEYANNPQFDWAYAIARYYFYGLFKQARLEGLAQSTYLPLAFVSQKMQIEHGYHLMHWQVWFKQLANSTDEAKRRLNQALQKVWDDLGELFCLGSHSNQIVQFGLITGEELLFQNWQQKAKEAFAACGLEWLGDPRCPARKGRSGEHTEDFVTALQTLSEVYRLDPAANW